MHPSLVLVFGWLAFALGMVLLCFVEFLCLEMSSIGIRHDAEAQKATVGDTANLGKTSRGMKGSMVGKGAPLDFCKSPSW